MRRYLLPVAVVLLTAACSSGTSKPAAAAHSLAPRSAVSSPTAAHSSSPGTTRAKPSASAKSCPPTRDVLVWTKFDGVPAAAAELGNYNAATCEPMFNWLTETSPTNAGDCTEAAWASDNPGYNVDADPAPKLKHIQLEIGPAC